MNGYQTVDWTDDRKPADNPRQGLRTAKGHAVHPGARPDDGPAVPQHPHRGVEEEEVTTEAQRTQRSTEKTVLSIFSVPPLCSLCLCGESLRPTRLRCRTWSRARPACRRRTTSSSNSIRSRLSIAMFAVRARMASAIATSPWHRGMMSACSSLPSVLLVAHRLLRLLPLADAVREVLHLGAVAADGAVPRRGAGRLAIAAAPPPPQVLSPPSPACRRRRRSRSPSCPGRRCRPSWSCPSP